MPKVSAHTTNQYASIDQLPLQRDWMDITYDRHAYQCFPMNLANRLGWTLTYPEDISFIWNGTFDSRADHVKILKGEKYVYSGRGSATISFNTGISFSCEEKEDLSLLTMPVPNQFIRGTQCITTIVSPSALGGEMPLAWMITEPNVEITIPAGTPICAILPVSLTDIQNHPLTVTTKPLPQATPEWLDMMRARGDKSQELNTAGEWTHFYRDAVNHLGEPLGKHEAKKIIMKVKHED